MLRSSRITDAKNRLVSSSIADRNRLAELGEPLRIRRERCPAVSAAAIAGRSSRPATRTSDPGACGCTWASKFARNWFFSASSRQLLVRHGAPQEIRQPRGQLVFVQRADLGAVGTIVQFGSEQELGRAQHGLHGQLQTGFPGLAAADGRLGQPRQPFDFVASSRAGGRPARRNAAGFPASAPPAACRPSTPAAAAGWRAEAGFATIARCMMLSAAARYRSISTGDIVSTSPMLSKPWPMSSDGKSSVGSKSTPIRSRIVFRYSVRFSRRIVTRPGSGLASRAARSKDTSHGAQESLSLVRRRLRLAFRGHAARLDHSDHRFPAICAAWPRRHRRGTGPATNRLQVSSRCGSRGSASEGTAHRPRRIRAPAGRPQPAPRKKSWPRQAWPKAIAT